MPANNRVQRKKIVHSITVSAFVHATEEDERVLAAMHIVVPSDLPIQKERVTGHFGNPIITLRARIEQAHAIRRTLNAVKEKLSPRELNTLKQNASQYLDNNCNLFIRFDKQSAARGMLKFGREDPILLKLKLAAYPARRETALELVRKLWNDVPVH